MIILFTIFCNSGSHFSDVFLRTTLLFFADLFFQMEFIQKNSLFHTLFQEIGRLKIKSF